MKNFKELYTEAAIKYQGRTVKKPNDVQLDPWSARDYAMAQLHFVADRIHDIPFSEGYPSKEKRAVLNDVLAITDKVESDINKLIGKMNKIG